LTGSCESWGFSSAHIRGTHVPVEEPSTASRADVQLDPEAIRTHCRSLIAGYKVPRSVEIRTTPLPLSGSGKVLKPALREEYALTLPLPSF
jgi:acyl-CoA synthetase (AMP-forming)/AMP-acid ligase II